MTDLPVEDLCARVLYRNSALLVLNKPAGYAVHGGVGKGHNLHPLLDSLRFGLDRAPELAHRLDKDTSGCLVLGRHRKALAQLGQWFADGKIRKTYWAVVVGSPKEDAGEISAPLRKLERRFGWIVVIDPKAGQPSISRWRQLGQSGRTSWLEVQPLTGRTHQIRAHLAHIGHPILGDGLYGRGTADLLADCLHLHARQIVIPQEGNKPLLTVTAPPPEHMLSALQACGYDGSDVQPNHDAEKPDR